MNLITLIILIQYSGPGGKHWILAFILRKCLNNLTKKLKVSTQGLWEAPEQVRLEVPPHYPLPDTPGPPRGPVSSPQQVRHESDLQSGLCTSHMKTGPEGSPTEHHTVTMLWLICVRLCQITTVGFKRKVHPKDENSVFKTRPHPLQFVRRMPIVMWGSR